MPWDHRTGGYARIFRSTLDACEASKPGSEIFPSLPPTFAWDPRRDIVLDRVRPDEADGLSLPSPPRVGFSPARVPSIRNSRMPRHGLIPRPWIITFRVVLIALAGLIGELT